MVAIKTLYGDRAAITLSQIQGIPLIAVEDYDSIRLLLVTDHPTPEIHELVETLSNKLKSYTDKKVAHKVLTFAVGPTERTYRKEVKTSGEPIWAFLAEQGT